MPRISKNILANIIGQGGIAVLPLLLLPLYMRQLGVESYGLVALYAHLKVSLTIFEFGFTHALNREMARTRQDANQQPNIAVLLFNVEWLAISVAIIFAILVVAISTWLTNNWFKFQNLPHSLVQSSFVYLGCAALLSFCCSFYQNILAGAEKQQTLRYGMLAFEIINAGFGLLWVKWIQGTVLDLFYWYCGVQFIALMVTRALAKQTVARYAPKKIGFSAYALKTSWPFASSMAINTVLMVLMLQSDKLLLSKLLNLGDFAIYSLAAVLASSLYIVAIPISQAIYPRLVMLYTNAEFSTLQKTYQLFSQGVSALLIPITLLLMWQGENLISWWTKDALLAQKISQPLFFLVLGNLFSALMVLPFSLSLVFNRPKIGVLVHAIEVIVFLPTLWWAVHFYQMQGATWVWCGLNFLSLLFASIYLHGQFLPAIGDTWLVKLAYPKDLVAFIKANTTKI